MQKDRRRDEGKASPFLRLLPPFVLGVWLGDGLNMAAAGWLAVAGLALAMAQDRLPLWSGGQALEAPALWLLMAGCGVGVTSLRQQDLAPRDSHPATHAADRWLLEVRSPPQPTGTGQSFLAMAWSGNTPDDWRQEAGCIVHVAADARQTDWQPGDRLLTKSSPKPLQGPRNPGGFDPRSHYGRQGASLTVSLRTDEATLVGHCNRHPARDAVFRLRDRLLAIVRNGIRHPDATGLAEALLIGYRGDLDRSLEEMYADTGVVHVIAISGLHIGLLYAILAAVFERIPVPRRYRVVRLVPPLAAIWVFSLLAGAGPSVVRSAAQFTLIGLGRQLTGRRGTSLNTLAASAFLLLAIRPEWIYDLGFQLSYAAVAGIVLFHRRLSGVVPVDNPFARWMRDGICMSLAAQVLTTPILLHHFGRFPTWFLFTNMVAVPLSTAILFVELLMCLTAGWGPVGQSAGTLAQSAILFLNDYVGRMARMPGGRVDDVHLTSGGTVAVYLAIAAAAGWLAGRGGRWRTALAACLALTAGLQAREWMRRSAQRLVVVWHLPGETLLLLVDGHTGHAYTNSRDAPISPTLQRALRTASQQYHLRGLRKPTHLPDTAVHIDWRGYTILVTGREGPRHPGRDRVDLVVLASGTPTDLHRWRAAVEARRWVGDGSHRLWKIRKWEEASAGLPLPLHSTSRSGAYVQVLR
jgi:competence protein ComEC